MQFYVQNRRFPMKKFMLFGAVALSFMTLTACSTNSSSSSPSASVTITKKSGDPQFETFISEIDDATQQLKNYDAKYESLSSGNKMTALTKILNIETDMLNKGKEIQENVKLSKANSKTLASKTEKLHQVEQSLSEKIE